MYEQRLDEFARGKSLLRLSRPVRDRADAVCDACGSALPRMLYGLKDETCGRYYFVGDTCLRQLVKRGAILKRFGKESGLAAYEAEIQRRIADRTESRSANTNGSKEQRVEGGVHILPNKDEGIETMTPTSAGLPLTFVTKTPDHFEAFVFIFGERGSVEASGFARELRHEETWGRGGERGMLLERVTQERTDAFDQAVTKAWKQAFSKLHDTKPGSASVAKENGGPAGTVLLETALP